MQELSFWRFTSKDSSGSHLKLDLGINSALSLGTQVLSIYAPFWLINKTGKMLTYRGQDPQNIVYHPKELEDVPMMFSYTTKSFLGNRKASLRVEDASWSDPFTLDTIKDAGKVVCKRAGNNTGGKHRSLNVGVNINMSQSSLTKIITFTSYYVILNTAEFSISVRELAGSEDGGSCGDLLEVPPGTCIPFWPTTASSKVEACVTDTPEFSAPISLHSTHTTLLMLDNKYGALFCELKTSNSEILLSFSSYIKGLAPVLLINTTRREYIEFGEKGNDVRELLGPGQSKLYTWQDPTGSRTLSWAISGYHCEHTNNLVSDQSVGIIQLDNDVELAWVSFLDGMQRVLLFTEDRNLCFKLAHSTGENERIEWELDVSIHGIGISVVNNAPNCSKEFLYTSITSSDIVWEIRRNGKSRYKSLTRAQCEALEADFQLYMREKTVGKRTSDQRKINVEGSKSQLHVDYDLSRMIQPTEGKIRRQFQKGLWLQVRTSAHQRQIHVKIHRIQVDNQLRACLFPVIMAPVPPPKSVLANSIPKPFIEISVLEYMTPEHTNLRQYKYLKALVQELHIKIDQGLLNAVSDLFEEEELLDEDITTFLNQDLSLARKPLRDIVKLQVTKGHKDFFDNLHLSPLKVHVSFSLTSYKSSKTNRRSNFFGLFLQSLGVTITDTDDIIFRLAYFERKHQFYSKEDLVDEMIHHYTSQAIKQAYVFIFGLDVIGNPLGLVVGVSRSVEDLFYEPFQGAVEGPSEFAEGLVIGVRSVFSGVVGGAAGTVSRITGALGKGLASLTFDEKFQNKRREAIKKRGRQTFGESFARGGKGLVMGFFDGVTGVAVKPVEGAMEEGVGGFFKGVSKGMVGLVARPTVGIVDFASGTFDSVKRVTEVTGEVSRVRPARFLHPDGVVRNYNLNEANGNKIMNDLEKGRYAESDNYVIHEIIQTTDKPSVFLVTSKRVLYVVFNQVLGSWSIDWEYLYNDITGPPPVGAESNNTVWYIVIKPKEERRRGVFGLFGGGESGRKVYVHSRNGAQNLARIIENLRTEKN